MGPVTSSAFPAASSASLKKCSLSLGVFPLSVFPRVFLLAFSRRFCEFILIFSSSLFERFSRGIVVVVVTVVADLLLQVSKQT